MVVGPAGVLVATTLVLVLTAKVDADVDVADGTVTVDAADGTAVVDVADVVNGTNLVVVVDGPVAVDGPVVVAVDPGRAALVAGAAVLLDVVELEGASRRVGVGTACVAGVVDTLGRVDVGPRTTAVAEASLPRLVAPAVVRATQAMAAAPTMAARSRQREVAEPRGMVG